VIKRAGKFYDAVLKPLDITRLSDGETSLGYGEKSPALWVETAKKPVKSDMESGVHFCFTAKGRAAVDAFHVAALRMAARTTASPASAPTTARSITRRSSSTPTAIASKPIAGSDLAGAVTGPILRL
jgi:hypothetical protein